MTISSMDTKSGTNGILSWRTKRSITLKLNDMSWKAKKELLFSFNMIPNTHIFFNKDHT